MIIRFVFIPAGGFARRFLLQNWRKKLIILVVDKETQKFNLPEQEEEILKFWEENKIFEKSIGKICFFSADQ